MFHRVRVLRVLKWVGSAACTALVASFFLSATYAAQFQATLGTHGLQMIVMRGCVHMNDVYIPASAEIWENVTKYGSMYYRWWSPRGPFWRLRRIVIWPDRFFYVASAEQLATPGIPGTRTDYWRVVLPLWMPLLLLAIPTVRLWMIDRRRPRPGHCAKCDYDLTANTSGICPECGEPVTAAARAS